MGDRKSCRQPKPRHLRGMARRPGATGDRCKRVPPGVGCVGPAIPTRPHRSQDLGVEPVLEPATTVATLLRDRRAETDLVRTDRPTANEPSGNETSAGVRVLPAHIVAGDQRQRRMPKHLDVLGDFRSGARCQTRRATDRRACNARPAHEPHPMGPDQGSGGSPDRLAPTPDLSASEQWAPTACGDQPSLGRWKRSVTPAERLVLLEHGTVVPSRNSKVTPPVSSTTLTP